MKCAISQYFYSKIIFKRNSYVSFVADVFPIRRILLKQHNLSFIIFYNDCRNLWNKKLYFRCVSYFRHPKYEYFRQRK